MATEPRVASTPPTHPAGPSTSPPSSNPFTSLEAYPFTTDQAFLSGLSQIFGHAGTPVTEAELNQKPDLVLSAKCFYFNRKFQTTIDPTAYKQWLSSQDLSQSTAPSIPDASTSTRPPDPTLPEPTPMSTPTTTTTIPPPTSSLPSPTTATSSEPQPPYPTSFAAIVDLITSNKPIPGIEEIPTTVLDPGSSKQDRATRRRKPWEKDVETESDPSVGRAVDEEVQVRSEALPGDEEGTQVQMDAGHDEGLLRLLRPDAVPDSGLVARD